MMSVFKEEFHFYKCLKNGITSKAEMTLFSLFVTEKINELELEFRKNNLDNDLEILYLFEHYTRRFVPNYGKIGREEITKYIDYIQERGYILHMIQHYHYLFNILVQFFTK